MNRERGEVRDWGFDFYLSLIRMSDEMDIRGFHPNTYSMYTNICWEQTAALGADEEMNDLCCFLN